MRRALSVVSVSLVALGCGLPYSIRHRVQPGENLATVASHYGVSETQLRKFNRLEDADRVRAGDIVFVPGPVRPSRNPSSDVRPRTPQTGSVPASPQAGPRPVSRAERNPAAPISPPRTDKLEAGFAWPVHGTLLRGFGADSPTESRGIDIGVPPGTPVRAAGPGTVAYAGTLARTYGPVVILEHDGHLYSVYSNLRARRVERGEKVVAAQEIGTSGDAQRSLPPHLHFEIRRNEQPLDPLLLLPSR